MSAPLVQIRCNSLRSKSSYGTFDSFAEEMHDLVGSTTTYWCLKTMGKSGPDEHFVHGAACVEGRSCWTGCEE